jgi:hypothetical protein
MKLKYDERLSNFAFNFNLRRYSKEGENGTQKFQSMSVEISAGDISYKGHHVRRCSLTLSNPR